MAPFILLIITALPPQAGWIPPDTWHMADPQRAADRQAAVTQLDRASQSVPFAKRFEAGAGMPADDGSSKVPIASRPSFIRQPLFRPATRERNSESARCEFLPQTTATTMVSRNGRREPAGAAFPALNDASGTSLWTTGACSGEAMR